MLLANPVAFHIGSLAIYWYGIIITLAILIAFGVVVYDSKRRKFTMDFMLELFLWVIPLAIVFARLAYVLFHASDFPLKSWEDLWVIISTRDGGISILGAIPGGALGAALACKHNKINYAEVLDMIAPGMVLGQALGRWGNFVNQELYGQQVLNENLQHFPFAVQIDTHYVTDEAGRVVDVIENGWFQATFFYEMVLNLIGFAVLWLISRKSKKNLTVFMSYLAWYCAVRAVMESIRTDAVSVGGVKIGVVGCALAAVLAFIVILLIVFNKIRLGCPRFLKPIDPRTVYVFPDFENNDQSGAENSCNGADCGEQSAKAASDADKDADKNDNDKEKVNEQN